MGLAIDSIAGVATIGAGPVFTALTMASGDSLTVRNFTPPAYCNFEEALINGTGTPVALKLKSPMLYDNVEGILLASSQVPAQFLVPRMAPEKLHPQDTLVAQVDGTATDVCGAVLRLYYSDLPGISARLAQWGDISSRIKHIKGIQVALTNSATPGTWTDALINVTEDLLAANTDHAILGYTVAAAAMAIAVKGQETGNLRIAGPGVTDPSVTRSYFVDLSNESGMPHIPIFNSANKNSFYVSSIDSAASIAVNPYLIVAELA